MNLNKLLDKIYKRDKNIVINKLVGIVEPTEVAFENSTIDSFNKQIVIRNGVAFIDGKIFWGKKVDEIPFSQEAKESLEKIKGVIMIERKINPEIIEESDFGGILN